MNNQLIILGGMGPQASLHLHGLLLSKSLSFHSGAPNEFPAILHASMQIPDFIDSVEEMNSAANIINKTCAVLPMDNAAAVGMACNTAHILLDKLQLHTKTFVSMIESVVKTASQNNFAKVGLLASPNTIRSNLYQRALVNADVATVTPSPEDVLALNDVIHRVIGGKLSGNERGVLSAIAKRLEAAGADSILLGCTELPLVGVDSNLPVIDSLSSLADAMLAKLPKQKV